MQFFTLTVINFDAPSPSAATLFARFKRTLNNEELNLKSVKYIYIQHSPVSFSMAYEFNAFNYFDAVQVINKFQYDDIIEINKL